MEPQSIDDGEIRQCIPRLLNQESICVLTSRVSGRMTKTALEPNDLSDNTWALLLTNGDKLVDADFSLSDSSTLSVLFKWYCMNIYDSHMPICYMAQCWLTQSWLTHVLIVMSH